MQQHCVPAAAVFKPTRTDKCKDSFETLQCLIAFLDSWESHYEAKDQRGNPINRGKAFFKNKQPWDLCSRSPKAGQ